MSEIHDLSQNRAPVDNVVMEMNLDQELKGLQYRTLTPHSGKMLSPTIMQDRKLNKWVQKEYGHLVRYCKTPNYIGASGDISKKDLDRIAAMFCVSNESSKSRTHHLGPVIYCKTPGYIGASDLNKEDLDRIAAMFCVTKPRHDGPQDNSALKLENIGLQVEQKTENIHKNVFYKVRSAIRRKFNRKIHSLI